MHVTRGVSAFDLCHRYILYLYFRKREWVTRAMDAHGILQLLGLGKQERTLHVDAPPLPPLEHNANAVDGITRKTSEIVATDV